MLQGAFLISSAAVILANFVADICYGYLDPRVKDDLMAATELTSRPPARRRRARRGRPRKHVVREDLGARSPAAPASAILIFFTLMALTAPWLAPEDPTRDFHPGDPGAARAPSTGSAPTATAPTCCPASCSARASRSPSASPPRIISGVIGAVVGIASGYYGGRIDKVLTAIDDWFLVIPFLPFAIVVATALGRVADGWPGGRVTLLIIVIGILSWAGTSRIVRSQVLSVKERQFIERAKALGRVAAVDRAQAHPARTCCRWCSRTRC